MSSTLWASCSSNPHCSSSSPQFCCSPSCSCSSSSSVIPVFISSLYVGVTQSTSLDEVHSSPRGGPIPSLHHTSSLAQGSWCYIAFRAPASPHSPSPQHCCQVHTHPSIQPPGKPSSPIILASPAACFLAQAFISFILFFIGYLWIVDATLSIL